MQNSYDLNWDLKLNISTESVDLMLLLIMAAERDG